MRRRTFVLLAAALVGGCLSPTLPLPPPEEPEAVSADEERGVWQVRGRCKPGAQVHVLNIDTGRGFFVDDRDADGRYFLRVDGTLCDRAEIWQRIDSDSSARTFFVLEPTTGGLPTTEDCASSN